MKVSAAAAGDGDGSGGSSLSAEERLLRWLQAQGINTENVTKSSLEKYLKGRPLYLKMGMQTIQAPSIVAMKDGEDAALKLPPAEVLEVELFEALQSHRRGVIRWLNELPAQMRSTVLGEIVRIALRSSEPDQSWQWVDDENEAGVGRYRCRKTEVQLDIQSGEILWRNDELKPVPDSMTQYADFKSIFGNQSLHCGLVVRQSHRMWIKVVGTDYELIEWDDPSEEHDQGVGSPQVYVPGVEVTGQGSGEDSELKMYWECPACTCANFNGDNPLATCEVCGTPRRGHAMPPPAPSAQSFGGRAQHGGQAPPAETGYVYLGETYSRPFDIYSEEDHPHSQEQWFIDLVGNTLRLLYPPEPEDKKLPFTLFLPAQLLPSDATSVRILGFDKGVPPSPNGASRASERDKLPTFKEIVAIRGPPQVVQIFSLVSHGRRMYRKLVFTSSSRHTQHGFPLNIHPDAGPVDRLLLRAGGDPRERQAIGGSLVVLRRNKVLGGMEQYVPPRLLQGIVPSSLLEAFRFWRGDDGQLRGDPLDVKSQWFRYRVQVEMSPDGTGSAVITRRSIRTSFSKIAAEGRIESSASAAAAKRVVQRSATHSVATSPRRAERPVEVRDEDVVQLMAMGFSYAGCALALKETRGNVGNAAQWLLDESNQERIALAEVEGAGAEDAIMSEDEKQDRDLALLMSVSTAPSRAAVDHALKIFERDVELARAWLEDPMNADEIARVDSQVALAAVSNDEDDAVQAVADALAMEVDVGGADDTLEVVEETEGDTLYLLNLVDIASKQRDLSRLASLLCRVEDLSHVLVWCHTNDATPHNICSIAFIEMPRLKIKLAPSLDPRSVGRVRLDVMDQNGWFVSDKATSLRRHAADNMGAIDVKSSSLSTLLSVAPDAWLLESETGDLRLIVPNHDVFRPRIQDEPLSNVILADRASSGWQQAMETRFYSYPIHSSRTFLLPPSLSSTLYLILTNMLTRRYSDAMEWIKGCNVDVRFTDEEQWIFNQFVKTLDDRHPSACACRIRLSLSIAYSENKAPWRLRSELHDYLVTQRHVDASCRLTLEEEHEALTKCHQRSPQLSLRKLFCDYALGLPPTGQDTQSVIDFKWSARTRVGGHPWAKLRLYSCDYLMSHAKKLSTVRYNRPKHTAAVDQNVLLDDEEAGKLVWNCAVVGDELSGTNRGLGFLFLYECLAGQITLRLGQENCTSTFGDLCTRFLHLKLSRWGRETVEEGEEESAPSLAMAQLALMIAHQDSGFQWATTPRDSESVRMLSFGANLYSKSTFGSLLKSFFEFGEAEAFELLGSPAHQLSVIAPLKAQFSDAHQRSGEHVVSVTVPPRSAILKSRASDPFSPSNASCGARVFLNGKEISAEFPLAAMDVTRYITFCDPDGSLQPHLPFDISSHPAAQTAAAQDLLKRLSDDVAANANAVNGSKDAFITGITPADVLSTHTPIVSTVEAAIERVQELVKASEELRNSDRRCVDEMIAKIEARANAVSSGGAPEAAVNRFVLSRRVGDVPRVRFSLLTSLLASDAMVDDLTRHNPFVGE
ncbi:hypothetical protein PINS_up011751 [Pythium insidiosum]|nr:hypothetical protein PINS_up011751 [Pythium insidiosum]